MSLRSGVFIGSVLMIVVGWIPFIGPLLAGLTAGIVSRCGMRRGSLAGFLSGLFGFLILVCIAIALAYYSQFPLGSLMELISLEVLSFKSQNLIVLGLLLLIIEAPIFGLIGGLIGGTLSSIELAVQKSDKDVEKDDSMIIQKLKEEKEEISKMLDNLNESLKEGKISQETYKELKHDFEEKLNSIDKKLKKLEKTK